MPAKAEQSNGMPPAKAAEARGTGAGHDAGTTQDQHKLSADIAATCIRFSTEKLDIMTAVKKDTHKENTFHREVLDTAPGCVVSKDCLQSVRDWWANT